jgi:hypothetical protein
MSIEGLDEFERNLGKFADDLKAKAEQASGEVPITELMPDAFIQAHTHFQTLQEMADAGGIEDVSELGREAWSTFVASNSDTEGWDALLELAATEYMRRKLSL